MNLLAVPRKSVAAWALVILAALAPDVSAQVGTDPSTVAAQTVEIRIVGRKPEGGARTVRTQRGMTIVLRIRSDEALSVHVHGYDVHADVKPADVTSLSFVANRTGRFPVGAHLHETGDGRRSPEPRLLYLEVLPE